LKTNNETTPRIIQIAFSQTKTSFVETLCSSSFSRAFNFEISAECRSMLCFNT